MPHYIKRHISIFVATDKFLAAKLLIDVIYELLVNTDTTVLFTTYCKKYFFFPT